MLAETLYILALFLGLSLVAGVLVAVHDGVERLLGRSDHAVVAGGGAPVSAGLPQARGRQAVPSAQRAWGASTVAGGQGRERPAWLDAAGRDVARREPGRLGVPGRDGSSREPAGVEVARSAR